MFKVLGSDSLLWSTLNWSSALPGGTLGDYLKASGRMRGEVCDERSDLCRLGIGHYEMVTGKPPYTENTPYCMVMKQSNDGARRMPEKQASCPIVRLASWG